MPKRQAQPNVINCLEMKVDFPTESLDISEKSIRSFAKDVKDRQKCYNSNNRIAFQSDLANSTNQQKSIEAPKLKENTNLSSVLPQKMSKSKVEKRHSTIKINKASDKKKQVKPDKNKKKVFNGKISLIELKSKLSINERKVTTNLSIFSICLIRFCCNFKIQFIKTVKN